MIRTTIRRPQGIAAGLLGLLAAVALALPHTAFGQAPLALPVGCEVVNQTPTHAPGAAVHYATAVHCDRAWDKITVRWKTTAVLGPDHYALLSCSMSCARTDDAIYAGHRWYCSRTDVELVDGVQALSCTTSVARTCSARPSQRRTR